jgi:hypothetical protein
MNQEPDAYNCFKLLFYGKVCIAEILKQNKLRIP